MRLIPSCAALLLLAAAPVSDPQELTFKVERGQKVEKSFEHKTTTRMVERSLSFNGEEMDLEEDGFELEIHQTYELRFLDEYRGVGALRPTSLAREFVQLGARSVTEMSFGGEAHEETTEEESQLEGRTVVFTWDEDGEKYTTRYDGERRGDPVLLEELEADTDLLGFLPGKPVAEGASWKLDAGQLLRLMDPGGELHLRAEQEGEEEPHLDNERHRQFLDNHSGEVEATFAGLRKEGELSLAVIELKGKVESHATLNKEDEDGDPVEDRYVLRTTHDGQILWDLRAGRPHALRLEIEVTLENVETTTWYDEDEGEEMELVMKMRFEGTRIVTGSWRARD